MLLIAFTQIQENYGAHDWNGKGECPDYWKYKGGNCVIVGEYTPNEICAIAQEEGGMLEHVREKMKPFSEDSHYWKEWMTSFQIFSDWEIELVPKDRTGYMIQARDDMEWIGPVVDARTEERDYRFDLFEKK